MTDPKSRGPARSRPWQESLVNTLHEQYGPESAKIEGRSVIVRSDKLPDILYSVCQNDAWHIFTHMVSTGTFPKGSFGGALINAKKNTWHIWVRITDEIPPSILQESVTISTEQHARAIERVVKNDTGLFYDLAELSLGDSLFIHSTCGRQAPDRGEAQISEAANVPNTVALRGHDGEEKIFVWHENASKTLEEALEKLLIDFRFNVRSQISEVRGPGIAEICEDFENEIDIDEWIQFTGDLQSGVRCRMEALLVTRNKRGKNKNATRPLTWSSERWNDALGALRVRKRMDPVMEYLKCLPEWDGKKRIDSLFVRVMGADDTPVNRYAAWVLLGSMVLRAKKPGCKADNCIVLYGPQGNCKSTFLEWLVPSHLRQECFNGGLRWLDDNNRMLEQSQGVWLGEWSELRGAGRASGEAIKQWFSLSRDKGRLAYRKDPEVYLRRFVVAGSTNNPTPIMEDGTGESRRFVVVTTRAGNKRDDVIFVLDRDRDQLFAEAIHRLYIGERPAFFGEIEEIARAESRGYMAGDDDLESALYYVLDDRSLTLTALTSDTGVDWKDLKDAILKRAGLLSVSNKKLRDTLTARGLYMKRIRIDGKKLRRWFLPSSGPESGPDGPDGPDTARSTKKEKKEETVKKGGQKGQKYVGNYMELSGPSGPPGPSGPLEDSSGPLEDGTPDALIDSDHTIYAGPSGDGDMEDFSSGDLPDQSANAFVRDPFSKCCKRCGQVFESLYSNDALCPSC